MRARLRCAAIVHGGDEDDGSTGFADPHQHAFTGRSIYLWGQTFAIEIGAGSIGQSAIDHDFEPRQPRRDEFELRYQYGERARAAAGHCAQAQSICPSGQKSLVGNDHGKATRLHFGMLKSGGGLYVGGGEIAGIKAEDLRAAMRYAKEKQGSEARGLVQAIGTNDSLPNLVQRVLYAKDLDKFKSEMQAGDAPMFSRVPLIESENFKRWYGDWQNPEHAQE